MGSDLTQKKKKKKKKKNYGAYMNLSYNLQKNTAGLQINKLHNYQQFNTDNSFFILFTMAVISDTNLRPVPGD